MTSTMYVISNNKNYELWIGPTICKCGKQLQSNEQHTHRIKYIPQIHEFSKSKGTPPPTSWVGIERRITTKRLVGRGVNS